MTPGDGTQTQATVDARTPDEERMVRFGYYANLAAVQWHKHPAADMLTEGGYDVAAVLREISDWCYGSGSGAAASLLDPVNRDAAAALGDLDPATTAADWLAPGRRTLVGYLHVVRGPRKHRYGLIGEVVADAVEAAGRTLPRYQDLHAVWFGYDPDKPERHNMVRPFLRYKASRPIAGLGRECNNHRVELTCTVGEQWSNGLGAYITRATGRCIDPTHVEPAGRTEHGNETA